MKSGKFGQFCESLLVQVGNGALNLFKDLPSEAFIFPYLAVLRAVARATHLGQRGRRLGTKGVPQTSACFADWIPWMDSLDSNHATASL